MFKNQLLSDWPNKICIIFIGQKHGVLQFIYYAN